MKDMFLQDLKKIRENHALSGISINPNTHVSVIEKYLEYCDVVLIMSVNPGASGQMFIEESIKKIQELDEIRKSRNLKFKIEVDGGVVPALADTLKKTGTDIVVSGSFVYNAPDKQLAIDSLR